MKTKNINQTTAPAVTPASENNETTCPICDAMAICQYVEQQVNEIEHWAFENQLEEVLKQLVEFQELCCPACQAEYFFDVLGIYTDRNQTKTFNQMWRLFSEIQKRSPESYNGAFMEAAV